MAQKMRALWKVKGGQRVPTAGTRAHKILQKVKAGVPYAEIAEELGISVQRVNYLRKFAGLPKRRSLDSAKAEDRIAMAIRRETKG